MTLTRITCDQCGWASKPATQARAEFAYRVHSCEKQHRKATSAARGKARMASVDRTPKPCLHKQVDHEHGTYACYVLDRCRCVSCAKAHHDYETHRVRQHAYGRWNGYVDAEPARRHVHELMAAGMGLKQIVKISGVSQGVIWKLIYGKRNADGVQVPSRRIRPETEQRILDTQPNLAGGALVDQTGTARRIQALVAIGYSMSKIADALGIMRCNFTEIAHGRRRVTAATERAVRDLYERWSMQVPQPTEWRDKISVNRSRHYAQQNRWLPPLAWDDDIIDDPKAQRSGTEDIDQIDELAVEHAIAGYRVTLTRTERIEAVRRLTALGASTREIAERLRADPRQVSRDRSELRQLVEAA